MRPSSLTNYLSAPRCEFSFQIFIGNLSACANGCTRSINFALQELIVLSRVLLSLNEFTHHFSYDLRCRTMGGFAFSHELVAKLWLKLHC